MGAAMKAVLGPAAASHPWRRGRLPASPAPSAHPPRSARSPPLPTPCRYSNPRAGIHDDSVPTSPRESPAPKPCLPGVLAAISPCPELCQTQTVVGGPGAQLYINDGMALHAVRCADDTDWEEGVATLVRRRGCWAGGWVRGSVGQSDGSASSLSTLGYPAAAAPGMGPFFPQPTYTHTSCHPLPLLQHLYAPPVRRVYLYEPEEDRVVQRVPGIFSKAGVPLRKEP